MRIVIYRQMVSIDAAWRIYLWWQGYNVNKYWWGQGCTMLTDYR